MMLSIVVPLHNEELAIPALFPRLIDSLEKTECQDYEIICVDDGSADKTVKILEEIRKSIPQIKVVVLSRNFGLDVAVSAGLAFAKGDAVIPMDADLQDPPELIPQMIDLWQAGNKVIIAVRNDRAGETWLKKTTASLFYRLFNLVSDIRIPYNSGNYRLLDRKVVDIINTMPERTRFLRAMSVWVGFKQTIIAFDRESRVEGQSKFNFRRMLSYAIDGITSFSAIPLRIVGMVGLMISSISFFYAVILIVIKLFFRGIVPGYTSLMVGMLFLGGVQLLSIGILGEYLGRVYNEVKSRPLYIVQEKIGIE